MPWKKLNKKRAPRKSYKKAAKKSQKKLTQNTVYRFKRYYAEKQSMVLIAGNLEQDFAFQFQFNLVQNYTEFTQLYDQYQITGALVILRLMTNPDATNIAMPAGAIFPTMWWVIDPDDASAITLSQIKQHQGVKRKVLLPGRENRIYVKYPKTAMPIYNGITSAYASTPRSTWLDCTNPDIPHYGIKFVLDTEGFGQAGNYVVQTETVLYFKLKGTL